MEWLEFGGDMTAMMVVVGVFVVGFLIFIMTRKNID